MPTDDGPWFDDDEGRSPSGPQTQQPSPEDTVSPTQPWAFAIPLKNGELLTESQVFNGHCRATQKPSSKKQQNRLQHAHRPPATVIESGHRSRNEVTAQM